MKKKTKKVQRLHKTKTKHPKILLGHARFLPAILISLVATLMSLQPHTMLPNSRQVLAYATNMSTGGLLSATNVQRSNNGTGVLTANSQLQSAAQAKAQDMANRGYWSHETPDGDQPWVFVTAAGYQYSAAGENLAYGFLSSDSAVTGWMNSPPHKANLISTNFIEVGFGIANSADYCYWGDHDNNASTADTYQCYGNQTIVVAMYGKPLNYTPPAPSAPSVLSTPQSTAPKPATPAPAIEPVIEEVPSEEETSNRNFDDAEPIATATQDTPPPIAGSTTTNRVDLLGGPGLLGASAVTVIVLLVGVAWVVHKGFHLRKYIVSGEHFFMHHLHFDMTVLSVLYLGFVLLAQTGVVR